jgi:hypothetical protein
MKGSHSRASNKKNPFNAAHGMGKQLKDCDGFTERWRGKNCFAAQKALMHLREDKRDFL